MEIIEQEKISKSLSCLRSMLEGDSSKNANIPPEFLKDDAWLLRFIRVRKFDIKRAHVMIKEYVGLRRKNKKIFYTLPTQFREMFDTGMFVILKERDPLGRKVFLFRTALWNVDLISVDQIIAATFVILEELVESEETVTNGVVFVADQGTLGFKHFKQFSLSRVLLILSVLQGKFPLLCKGLHNVNDPTWLARLGAFAKPFFSAKLQKRVHFHGEDFANFHKFCPQSMLPIELGGDHSWDEVQDCDLFTRLYSKEGYYQKLTAFWEDV